MVAASLARAAGIAGACSRLPGSPRSTSAEPIQASFCERVRRQPRRAAHTLLGDGGTKRSAGSFQPKSLTRSRWEPHHHARSPSSLCAWAFGASASGGGEAPLDESSIPRELKEAIDLAMDSEESKALLQDLAAAEERVLRAKAELEEVARQERKLMELRAELEIEWKADARLEKAEEEVSQLLTAVSAAEEELRLAGAALVEARSGEVPVPADQTSAAERIESVKALAICAVAGSTAYLPLLLASEWDLLTLISGVFAVGATSGLMGVTFRYAVRRDSANVNLKSGVVGAFAICQALARLDHSIWSLGPQALSFDYLPGVLASCGEEAIALLASAVCLEYCLQNGIVSPFPSKRG